MRAVGALVAVSILHLMVFGWKLRQYRHTSPHLRDRRVLYSDLFLLVSWLIAVGFVILFAGTGG